MLYLFISIFLLAVCITICWIIINKLFHETPRIIQLPFSILFFFLVVNIIKLKLPDNIPGIILITFALTWYKLKPGKGPLIFSLILQSVSFLINTYVATPYNFNTIGEKINGIEFAVLQGAVILFLLIGLINNQITTDISIKCDSDDSFPGDDMKN